MKIQLCDPVDDKAKNELEKFAEVVENSEPMNSDADVLVVRSKTQITKEVIDSALNLKAIVRAGVGLDNIDTKHAESKNIQVLNTPEAPTEAVAELVIGLMLSLLRNIPKADASIKNNQWLKKELKGSELQGKTLGLIGFGRIGHRVAELAKAFNARVIVFDPFVKPEDTAKAGAEKKDLMPLLQESDIISIHAPLVKSTKGLLNSSAFTHVKEGAYLVNTARGPIVDEKALYKALKSGKLAGAALDVYWGKTPEGSKLLELTDQIIFTPHLGASTRESQERIGILLIEKIKSLQ